MSPVTFEDLTLGMKLKDNEKHECVVKKIYDNHNVLVEYIWGNVNGYGFLCLDPNCETFDSVYKT